MHVQQTVAERAALQLRGISRVGRLLASGLTTSRLIGAGTDLNVGHTAVAIIRISRGPIPCRFLSLQFGLNAQRFHLIHFANGLFKILGKLAAIVLVACIECDEDFAIDLLRQLNAERIVGQIEQVDDGATERETVAERVRDRCLLLAEDFRDHKQIVEEEHLTLMDTRALLFVHIGYFVQSTIADQATMRQRQIGLLAHYGGLHLHDLCDMIAARFEFIGLDTLEYATKHILINVMTIIDAPQVLDEVLHAHAALWLQIGRMQIRIQHDDGKCQHKDLRDEASDK